MSKIHQLLLDIFGQPLPQFCGDSLPSEAEVVRHYIWHCNELRPNKNLVDSTHISAKTNVADSLYKLWKSCGYEEGDLMAIGNIKRLVKSTYDGACKLSKVKKEKRTKDWKDEQLKVYSKILDIKPKWGSKEPSNLGTEQVRILMLNLYP